MKRRVFIQTMAVTGLSLSSAGLVTGCKSLANKKVSTQPNLYQAEFIQNASKVKHKSNSLINNKSGYLKVEKKAFTLNNSLAVPYNNNVIGLIKLNDNNFAASLLVCPHRGCSVEFITASAPQQNSYVCPCHGARFTEKGQVTKGPATKNLTTFITHTDQYFVYIHLTQ
jgi:cytochrome b6-f complex iron-sulfur subunit